MSRDRSLDEFLGDDAGDQEPGSPDAVGDTGEDRPDGEETEPASSTYRWHPDGEVCDRCGETVPDRWRSGDAGLVCGKCKDW